MKSKNLRKVLISEIERTFEKWVIDIHPSLNFLGYTVNRKAMLITFLKDNNRKSLKISDLKIVIFKTLSGDIYNVVLSSEKYGITHLIKVCL